MHDLNLKLKSTNWASYRARLLVTAGAYDTVEVSSYEEQFRKNADGNITETRNWPYSISV